MKGAVMLQSWTSSISTGSTSLTRWIQLLTGCRSGTSPPASIARFSAIRSNEADPAVIASDVSACGVGAQWSVPGSGSPAGAPDPEGPRTSISGRGPSGSSAASAEASRAYDSGERRTVWAALLIRMSSGPRAATESARATTAAGLRRSMPTMRSRCSHSALSGIPRKRRAASRGKRVVIVVWAPSRSSRRAMYMPIFARPPVSSAVRPVRSVRAVRRWWLRAAQSGHSWW